MKNIAFPHAPGKGGPGSFQKRFENQLKKNEYKIVYANEYKIKPDLIFIVGGTSKLFWLFLNKLKGIPIIYRLDGINWIHKKRKNKIFSKNYLIPEVQNFLSKLIHSIVADEIIYQSNFVKDWWDKKGWIKKESSNIIYNGVNLEEFKPSNKIINENELKLLCLEGYLDYTPYAIDLINFLYDKLSGKINIEICGDIFNLNEREKLNKNINYRGKIEFQSLSEVYKNSIYLSLDINAACPNTVMEALASGAPVVGFDTGCLKELVINDSGIVVPYEGNPWEIDIPNFNSIIEAILKIKSNYQSYSTNARKLAIGQFDFNNVSNEYIKIINKNTK